MTSANGFFPFWAKLCLLFKETLCFILITKIGFYTLLFHSPSSYKRFMHFHYFSVIKIPTCSKVFSNEACMTPQQISIAFTCFFLREIISASISFNNSKYFFKSYRYLSMGAPKSINVFSMSSTILLAILKSFIDPYQNSLCVN